MENYIKINRHSWNSKVAIHLESEFYDNESFIKGRSSLNEIELDLLDDLAGKSILHLQCHFGQDTISLARKDARVTGVDFSEEAIAAATEMAQKTGAEVDFICCDIYDLPNHLDRTFDIVFTSYGTIGWLPDINKWAEIVNQFLRPGGKFVFVEFHPVVWMFDDDFEKVKYNYFNDGPISETLEGTYAEVDAEISLDYVMWNHGLEEVIMSLINQQLTIASFQEYDYSPYNCFKGMTEVKPGQYRIKKMGKKLPMVYALIAKKSA